MLGGSVSTAECQECSASKPGEVDGSDELDLLLRRALPRAQLIDSSLREFLRDKEVPVKGLGIALILR